MWLITTFAILVVLSFAGCSASDSSSLSADATSDAKKFVDDLNQTMLRLVNESNQASWVAENFITDDTEAITARANKAYIDAIARFAKEAVKFDKTDVPADI